MQCAKFGISANEASIYAIDFPCLQYTKSLLQTGIREIDYIHNYHNDDYTIKLPKPKNVALHQIKLDSDILEKVDLDQHINPDRK